MITFRLRIAMLMAIVVYFMLVFRLLKQKSLNLKYTLLWLLSGLVMLGLACFPQMLGGFSKMVGIYEPTNALFAIIFFCVIVILMSLTAIVSKLNEKCKRLIQALALLEERLRKIESEDKN